MAESPPARGAKSDLHVRFGANLAQLRAAKGLSQEQAAIQCKMPRAYYSDVESGRRNVGLANIVRLCEALDVEPGELFDGVVTHA